VKRATSSWIACSGGAPYHAPRGGSAIHLDRAAYGAFRVLCAGLAVQGCSSKPEEPEPPAAPAAAPAAAKAPGNVVFVEAEEQAGIKWLHVHGGTGQKYLVETMGSGGGVIDYDNDGLEDIYLVQGGALPGFKPAGPLRNALYRNVGGGRFTDVTEKAHALGRNWGMGFCAADIDNDGDIDLYTTALGANTLLVNEGNGTFREATDEAGVGDTSWGSSCAFGDLNGDGAVDLYVVNYVDFTVANHKTCGNADVKRISYCHPDVYNGVSGVLYLNNFDGTFTDATRESGAYNPEAKGLGVILTDTDDDGDLDIYVANDSVANFLFVNDGTGHFEEEGLFAGVAYNENGKTQAGMGVDSGDSDNDGDLDILVTNLDSETNAFYLNLGRGNFRDDSFGSGIGEPSILFVGFGTNFVDFDNDGDLDIFVANGHVLDDVDEYNQTVTYAERAHLLVNEGGGKFVEEGRKHGAFFSWQGVARGSAAFDMDLDGDEDMLLTYNNQEAKLLRNDGGNGRHWLGVKVVGRESNRSGIGTRLEVSAQGKRQVREIKAGSSYCSQSSLIAHFGLGDAGHVDSLVAAWPSGKKQEFRDLDVDEYVTLDEDEGLIAR